MTRRWRLLAILLIALAASLPARASTVLEMSFRDLLTHAELVFEGRVTARQSFLEADGLIYTRVDFDVRDVLKGEHAGTTLALRFLGGTLGPRRLEVTDMQMPEPGETGIYFIESLDTALVNPLVGWSQGHFLIEPQAGGEPGVLTSRHEPVLGLESVDTPPVTAGLNAFSKGVAKGVVVQESLNAQAVSRPLSVEDFKRTVRALVAESQ